MRLFLQALGTTLIAIGALGLGIVFLSPPSASPPPAHVAFSAPLVVSTPTTSPRASVPVRDPVIPPSPAPVRPVPRDPVVPPLQPERPITWLAIPSIDLVTDVVPAQVVADGDSLTWDVPKFVAGHAQSTAGAGEPGNAVVLGHVVSLTLGNVFEHLDRARPGDVVRVRSGEAEFDYTIDSVTSVDRTDVDVLDDTATPTITLITCTGVWNPVLHDYMQRLVVRGELTS
jgi:sortase A